VTELSETVRQESAALYRFIDSVIRRCAEIHEYPVYSPSSEKFLQHVKKLGAETKEFLKHFPLSVEKDKDTARSKRRKLNSVRGGWENLHEYLQAALAADTLHVPTSLIFAIQDQINRLEDLENIRFTVFHSDQVNYLQLPPGTVKEAADELADIVKGTRFPESLGLIGMPFSQSDGFLLNCLLAHEMGHVAYQGVYSADVTTKIERTLDKLVDEVGLLDEHEITLSLDTLKYWTEEIFCDLFAICLIGPAYSFALIELTGATLLSDSPSTMVDMFHSFMEYHPAEIARFYLHVMLHKKLGWWPEIEKISSPYVDVLRVSETKSANVRIETTTIPESIGDERFLKCFWEISVWLVEFVPAQVSFASDPIKGYREQSGAICESFRQAVVPSTVVINGERVNPDPVVLINAAFRFYLEGVPNLIDNMEQGDRNSVESRSWATERLEMWALKAIEDCRLLRRAAAQYGGHS
jgi:hypothetical protein